MVIMSGMGSSVAERWLTSAGVKVPEAARNAIVAASSGKLPTAGGEDESFVSRHKVALGIAALAGIGGFLWWRSR
jgi:hypothetical protein